VTKEIKPTTDELIKGYEKHPESQWSAVAYAMKLARKRVKAESK
jgi:hypothetical protein